MTLAWGLRGQHGHEKGSALAGAMVGLSLAAVTGGPRWIGAAVIGSLTFAKGGALSYVRFVSLAYQGSLEAVVSLALIGFSWGGVGALGLGLGLALPRYRLWERATIAGSLFLVWFLIDRLLWSRLSDAQDLATRELMVMVLLGSWILLSAYVGVWRQDRTSLRLALGGAFGFGLGFPLAAWVQGIGNSTGLPLDWWKVGEHLIGLLGGIGIGLAVLPIGPSSNLPLAVRPWERWFAAAWLLWFLPSWLIANNMDFWISEKGILPVWTGTAVWIFLAATLVGLAVWGWLEMRRGRTFVTSWLPGHLRFIFLLFVWMATAIASSKTLLAGEWSAVAVPIGFVLLAVLIHYFLKLSYDKTR